MLASIPSLKAIVPSNLESRVSLVNTATVIATVTAPFSATVTVIGGANIDITANSAQRLVLHDSNPGSVSLAAGGVGRNIAENLARLDCESHLVSAVGNDDLGRRVLDASRDAGVNVSAVRVLPGQRTASYVSVHGPQDDLAGDPADDMAVAVNDMAILNHLTPDMLQDSCSLMQSSAVLVVDCNLPSPLLQWVFDRFSSTDKRVCPVPVIFADGVSAAKCLKLQPFLPQLHLLKVNAFEAAVLCGRPVQSMPQARAAALQLHQSGVANVVVSLGALGMCWCDAAGQTGQLEPDAPSQQSPIAHVNSSGAGDALMAGLVAAHLRQQPLAQAVKFGMACAELTLTCHGPCHPDLARLVPLLH